MAGVDIDLELYHRIRGFWQVSESSKRMNAPAY